MYSHRLNCREFIETLTSLGFRLKPSAFLAVVIVDTDGVVSCVLSELFSIAVFIYLEDLEVLTRLSAAQLKSYNDHSFYDVPEIARMLSGSVYSFCPTIVTILFAS